MAKRASTVHKVASRGKVTSIGRGIFSRPGKKKGSTKKAYRGQGR